MEQNPEPNPEQNPEQIRNKIRNKIRNEIRNEIRNKIRNQIWETRNKTRNEIREIWNKMSKSGNKIMGTKFHSNFHCVFSYFQEIKKWFATYLVPQIRFHISFHIFPHFVPPVFLRNSDPLVLLRSSHFVPLSLAGLREWQDVESESFGSINTQTRLVWQSGCMGVGQKWVW